jgi:hypothetical protein
LDGRNVPFFLDPLRKDECELPWCFPVYFSFVLFLRGYSYSRKSILAFIKINTTERRRRKKALLQLVAGAPMAQEVFGFWSCI